MEIQTESSTPPHQPLLVGAAAWALPGAGYWLLGEKARGMTVGITVLALFIMGLVVGGVRILEVPMFDKQGRPVSATLLQEIRAKPWSVAQIMTGPLDVAAGALSVDASRPGSQIDPASGSPLPAGELSHSRTNEIAILYTAVAGMLNLLAIIDSVARASVLTEAA